MQTPRPAALASFLLALSPSALLAQNGPPEPAALAAAEKAATAAAEPAAPTTAEPPGALKTLTPSQLTLSGYVEAFYQWNFNRPSNGVTNLRAFDTRHNTFTLSNAVLDASYAGGPVSGRVALQIGHTPETDYLAEPSSPGGPGSDSTSRDTWKLLQQANVGYKAPWGRGVLFEAGIFLSPAGPEAMAVKDNWAFSRSNLFFGLPFYHTGLRATYAVTDELSATLCGFNGWNSVVDNNDGKTAAASLVYSITDKVTASLTYIGGPERPKGSPEGQPWRSLFDAYVVAHPDELFSFYLHGDAGFEKTSFGTSSWEAFAGAVRLRPAKLVYLAARGDFFREVRGANERGEASPIAFPASWVSSQTATVDLRPYETASIRLELRHDQAASRVYYRGHVDGDGGGSPFVPNARAQNTATAGMVTWF